MGLQLCLGLMLLLGWGTTQDPSFSDKSTDAEHWPKLEMLMHLPFSCNPKIFRSNISSTSVNTLRPSDIQFVASIGIKETLAASSTVSIMEKLNWTEKISQEVCLGVGTVLTDIIGYFNPAATRLDCPPLVEVTPQPDAEPLWIEATELVRNMKENPQLDFENDWKLINVFISNAHECHLCPVAGQNRFVTRATNKLVKTMDYLQQEVPRAFVNLVDLTDILESFPLPESGSQGSNSKFCRCSEEMVLSKDMARWSYQETWESALASSKYNRKDSFAVVFQPFFYETDWFPLLKDKPLQDPSGLGLHLWNIIMEPAGLKEKPYSEKEKRLVKCPSQEHPYLFTYKNSNYMPRLAMNYPILKAKQVLFECPDMSPSETVPQSVHKLKPADIKVVTAVGDSLMAVSGPGITPGIIRGSLNVYEGLSWSIGGYKSLRNIITLPNILRKFNPTLTSFSLGYANSYNAGARLKATAAGVSSMDMPDQVTEVIRKMKNDQRINYKDDWKLLTMFIGRSDLCHSCTQELSFSPENFQNNVQRALDILHKEVPRMIVNMVLPLEIIGLRSLIKETGNKCPQDRLRKSCPCVMKYGKGTPEYGQVIMYNKKYQKLVRDMVESGRYDTRDDFTVVLQPFLEKLDIPRTKEGKPDLTYFAPDCFHLSQKMLGHIASALWNNMLEAVGEKSRQHDFTSDIALSCPMKEQPYLRTHKNNVKLFLVQSTIDRCRDKSPSSRVPGSVHTLKPGDIKVVGAIGDYSIIGRGVLDDSAKEYRGVSFSTGGEKNLREVVSIPNILRLFNREVKGTSVQYGRYDEKQSGLNLARPGVTSGTLLDQSIKLERKMKDIGGINYNQDWKIITIMIGNEELCYYCNNPLLYTSKYYGFHIQSALDYLHEKMPRTLVNLMYFLDPFIHRTILSANMNNCPPEARLFCDCALIPKAGSTELIRLENLARQYRNALFNVLLDGRYDTRDDFTVVLQPVTYRTLLPIRTDGSIDRRLLTISCKNLGLVFHTTLAIVLWNNMFEKLGQKTELMDMRHTITPKCPGAPPQENGYIKTRKNSNYTYPKPRLDQDWGNDFFCTIKNSVDTPRSVHKLRPSDIQVVGAMGDWITTARGSSLDTYGSQESWKGLSWSIGGDKDLEKMATLPNIIRKFNVRLQGYSRGSMHGYSGLNVAEENARAQDLPNQATQMLQKMKRNPAIDFTNDWKMVTILIGINDLCDFCSNEPEALEAEVYTMCIKYHFVLHSREVWSPSKVTPKKNSSGICQPDAFLERFKGHISTTLGKLFSELPRVFINLVEPMQVTSLYEHQGGECAKKNIKCPCFRGTVNSNRIALVSMNTRLQKLLNELSTVFSKKNRDDFVVVAQPFFRRSTFPRNTDGTLDPSFFIEDCFHFSTRTQNELAIALWNNMLEPVGLKSTYHNFKTYRKKLSCPSTFYPYIFTPKNSGIHWAIWVMAGLGVLLLFYVLCTIIWYRRRALRETH